MKTMSTASSSRSNKKRKRRDSICLGIDDFDEIIEENAALIDKTMFIKEWKEKSDKVDVFLRPRRFGKSTNLSMLKSFFSLGAESKDFSRFSIGKQSEFIKKHCGKYPVVFLNMKEIGGDSWEEMLSSIWLCLREAIRSQRRSLDEKDIEYIGVDYCDATAQPNKTIAAAFLKQLTVCVQEKYKKRVIVLIDEYDAPLNHAFRKGFYDKASSFFGRFYSNDLKGNSALENACLMGIVELRGAGMLSGLNNLKIYSSADEEFSQYFGFTEFEVREFLVGDKIRIPDVMEWYNGYCMGSSHQVINLWSFMNYIDSGELQSYWVETSNIDSLHTIINPVVSVQLIKVLADLYNGNGYEICKLSTKVDYGSCSFDDIDLILCFLVHTGYLTYKDGRVYMPKEEIKYEWKNCTFGVTESKALDSELLSKLIKTFRADAFDIADAWRASKLFLF